MKRIVDEFYLFDRSKECQFDVELVSTLKDAEMYTNIYSKRSFKEEEVTIIKAWIYSLSAQKWSNDDEKIERNKQAKRLLHWIMFKRLSLPFNKMPNEILQGLNVLFIYQCLN